MEGSKLEGYLGKLYFRAKREEDLSQALKILEALGRSRGMFMRANTPIPCIVRECGDHYIFSSRNSIWGLDMDSLEDLLNIWQLPIVIKEVRQHLRIEGQIKRFSLKIVDPNYIPGLDGKPFPKVGLDIKVHLGKSDQMTLKEFLWARNISPVVFDWEGKTYTVPIKEEFLNKTKSSLLEKAQNYS